MRFLFQLAGICLFAVGCGPKERFLDEVQLKEEKQQKRYYLGDNPYSGSLIDRSNPSAKIVYTVEAGSLNGIAEYFDENSTLTLRETYRNGVLNGRVESFYLTGVKRYSFNFLNGQQNGKQQRYYPSGKLKEELFYEADKLKGDNFLYYTNGVLQHHFHFNALGQRHGRWEKFYSNGTLKEEINYEKGVLLPPIKRYDMTGKLINYTP